MCSSSPTPVFWWHVDQSVKKQKPSLMFLRTCWCLGEIVMTQYSLLEDKMASFQVVTCHLHHWCIHRQWRLSCIFLECTDHVSLLWGHNTINYINNCSEETYYTHNDTGFVVFWAFGILWLSKTFSMTLQSLPWS